MTRQRCILFFTLVSLILSTAVTPSQAGVVDISECRIPASKDLGDSLGFPLHPERISSSKPAQILVVPIVPSDLPDYQFSQDLKDNYINAANDIEKLSFGRAKINYIFAPVHRSQLTVNDFIALGNNVQSSWDKKDLTKSTWGFVRNTIKELDPGTNFTNIDSVILEVGPSPNHLRTAEAFQFYSNNQDSWFDPIRTNEGYINNAVLFGQHRGKIVIAHEIMHNYGLIDLYGAGSGPGPLSLMGGVRTMILLNYEKWILGWLDDFNVTCLDGKTLTPLAEPQWKDPLNLKPCTKIGERIPNQIFELVCAPLSQTQPGSSSTNLYWQQNHRGPIATPITSPNLTIDSSVKMKNDENQLIVINTGGGTGLMIEVIRDDFNVRRLAFYSLDNQQRPPITFWPPDTRGGTTWTLEISDPAAIGSLFKSEKLSLLVSNITQDEISLTLIPESLKSTDEAKNLISQSITNRAAGISIARIAAADKAVADAAYAKAVEEKAVADKILSDAKAAADKILSDAKAVAVAKKKTTITCTKGKLVKKISAVKPKCPSGYKVKK